MSEIKRGRRIAMKQTNDSDTLAFDKKRSEMAEYYTQFSNTTRKDADEAENRLSGTLTTAALALIAVIAATIDKKEIGDNESLYGVLILSTIAFFIVSVLFSVIHCLILHRYFDRAAKTSEIIVHQYDAAKTPEDANIVSKVWLQILKEQCGPDAPRWGVILQIGSFMIAIILLLASMSVVLFS